MSGGKMVLLDGCGLVDDDLAPVLHELLDVFGSDGAQIETIHLRELKLAHCLGCFNCWVKTPGICVENDAGRQIAKAVIQSDTTVFFAPVTFGGYSPDLKRTLDHFVQLISPFFAMDNGEVHHPPRYAHRPRLIVVGVQRRPNPHEAHILKTLAGRNAINLHPPSYAAEVVVVTDDASTLRQRFEALKSRSDALPYGDAAASLMPQIAGADAAGVSSPQRALLIVGSPRTDSTTTSSVLGQHVLERLGKAGWETASLTLRASLNRQEGESELLGQVDLAGLVLLVFPLYWDALPYLVTKALHLIAAHQQAISGLSSKRLVAIVNSGFPETHQNAVAMAICREFAAQSGMVWGGGLALGGGGMIGGQALSDANRAGLPLKHVVESLDLTAAALSDGLPVPAEAVRLMTKNPIPLIPFAVWRRIYMKFAGKAFMQEATRNGVSSDRLLDQPYAV